MSDIRFYHLTQIPLSQALPQLLERTMQAEKKAIIRVGNEQRLESLSRWLWVYKDDGWLPHGKQDDNADGNVIWLTLNKDNPINGEFLFVVEQAVIDGFEAYERVFYLFDGTNENELTEARNLWRKLKKQDLELAYWKQDENGRWQQAA
ncbi:MAG: DNA polymerase III subunit chi [Alphaproteobacteria bacterium]